MIWPIRWKQPTALSLTPQRTYRAEMREGFTQGQRPWPQLQTERAPLWPCSERDMEIGLSTNMAGRCPTLFTAVPLSGAEGAA
jgi:hypothetical protein